MTLHVAIAKSSATISHGSKVPGNDGIDCNESIMIASNVADVITFIISFPAKAPVTSIREETNA